MYCTIIQYLHCHLEVLELFSVYDQLCKRLYFVVTHMAPMFRSETSICKMRSFSKFGLYKVELEHKNHLIIQKDF